jgi:hypothetical protein
VLVLTMLFLWFVIMILLRRFTPESAAYPSATKALKAAARPFGLAGEASQQPPLAACTPLLTVDAQAGQLGW